MKKGIKILLYVLAVLMLLSFAVKFDFVAEPLAKAVGQPIDTIKDWANIAFYVSLGAFLIWAGVASLAVPVIGVSLIVVGVGLIGLALWTKFKKPDATVTE